MRPVFLKRKSVTESDEVLLERYRDKGDLGILGELYGRYMQLVYGVCLKYLEEREWAKDEVMNIFEKLVTTLPQQDIANFRTWLYVVTKNHCLMLLRSRKSETAHAEAMISDPLFFMENYPGLHPLGKDVAVDTDGGSTGGDPDSKGWEEAMRKLEECVEKLKEEQRICIRLFFYEGCSYREISGRTGIEESKVKSYIQNGKRNLRICMEGDG